jgi:pimeloyl-ACP methyl ester carboxylesterase
MTLHSQPISAQSRFISVRGIRFHYLEWGSPHNAPLLLIHGGSAHAHWWDHIAVELVREYHVIALDLRGHGDSGWAVPPSYEIDDYVEDIAAVVTQLHLTPFTLVGHSLGGLISLSYATRYSTTLRALVIVDMGPRLQPSRRMQLLSRIPAPIYRDEADLVYRFRLLPEETWAEPALLQHIARHSARPLTDGRLTLKIDRATFVRGPHDVSAQLSQITCPTLLIRGGASQTLSLERATEMEALCPRLQLREVPGASHHVFLDQPVAFLEAVRHFLQDEGRNSHAGID